MHLNNLRLSKYVSRAVTQCCLADLIVLLF